MNGVLERVGVSGWILKVLRVPADPSPPAGAANSLRVFQAAPGWLRYRRFRWLFKQAGALVGLVFGYAMLSGAFANHTPINIETAFGYLPFSFLWLEVLAVSSFLVQIPLSLVMLQLDYRYRWYMVTDRSLRIREGLFKVREQTMSFANIQNVSVEQGPIQRFFGIADLKVRTAGGGDEGGSGKDSDDEDANLHIGYFRGLDDVEGVRDAILSRQRRLRHSGLGDPDEAHEPAPEVVRVEGTTPLEPVGGPNELLTAAHELLGEAIALRSALR